MVQTTGASFDGRKARSKLKWEILRTLALEVGAPVLAAELCSSLRTLTPRGAYEAYGVLPRRSMIYNYLYRMAEEGCVKLARLRDGLTLYLTPAGRRQLRLYDEHWKGKTTEKSPPATMAESCGRRRRPTLDRNKPNFARRGFIRRIASNLKLRLAQCSQRRHLEGAHRTRAFISYDMPQSAAKERRQIVVLLRAAGFTMMHKSMYVGPVAVLKETVEAIESLSLLPFVGWGTITELTR